MGTPISILLPNVQTKVEALFNESNKPELFYHNLEHTRKVVQHSKEISAANSLSEMDQFILLVAAWFHDTGHLVGGPSHHEERSIIMMREYLKDKIDDVAIIDSIADCILATKLTRLPGSILQEIICDADTYNLGTEEFLKTDVLLKKEMELRNSMPVKGWDVSTLDMLTKHEFFTPYCQELLNKAKQKNTETVIKKIQKG